METSNENALLKMIEKELTLNIHIFLPHDYFRRLMMFNYDFIDYYRNSL